MLSKRKALIGWLVYTGVKPVAKQALRQGVKRVATPAGKSKKKTMATVGTVAAAAGATAGAVMFWRRRNGGDKAPGKPSDAGTPSAAGEQSGVGESSES
jgi:hypothetical protein